jgi:hypothetical protein
VVAERGRRGGVEMEIRIGSKAAGRLRRMLADGQRARA